MKLIKINLILSVYCCNILKFLLIVEMNDINCIFWSIVNINFTSNMWYENDGLEDWHWHINVHQNETHALYSKKNKKKTCPLVKTKGSVKISV